MREPLGGLLGRELGWALACGATIEAGTDVDKVACGGRGRQGKSEAAGVMVELKWGVSRLAQ